MFGMTLQSLFAGLVLSPFLCVQSALAAPFISNLASWDGSQTIGSFGVGGSSTQVYGQEFIPTGAETVLNDFTFRLRATGTPINVRAYVQQFNPGADSSVGNILFTSAPVVSAAGAGFNVLSFTTGGVALVAGTTYVAYISGDGLANAQTTTTIALDFTPVASPNFGQFRFANNAAFSPVTGPPNAWGTSVNFGQAIFEANFSALSAAPELSGQTASLPFLAVAVLLSLVTGRRLKESS